MKRLLLSLIVITTIAQARELTKQEKIDLMHELNIMYYQGVITYDAMQAYTTSLGLGLSFSQISPEVKKNLLKVIDIEQKVKARNGK